MKAIKYGSFDMQANGVVVVDTDVYSAPLNKIQADSLAERDGALVVKQQYDSKPFTVTGYIRKATQVDLENWIDTFKAAMAIRSQPFDIDHGGSVRRYLASARNIILTRKGLTTAAFSVEFLSPDGMGWDTSSSSLISSMGVTTSTLSITFTVGGSYKAEPIIRVTINTITGGTTKTVQLTNGTTLRTLSIQRTWVAGDVLELDTLKGQLLVNGLATDYKGSLPSFDPGANTLVYTDDFTARDVTILSSYTRRWL